MEIWKILGSIPQDSDKPKLEVFRYSFRQEIMNVWLKAEVQNFIRTDNVVSQLYRKLKYTNEAHWNDDGTVVEIQDTSDLMLL